MDPEKIMEMINPLKFRDKVIINNKILYRWDSPLDFNIDYDSFQISSFDGLFYKEWDKRKMIFPKASHKIILYKSFPGSDDLSKAVLENIETGEKEEVKSVYVDPELLEKRKNTKKNSQKEEIIDFSKNDLI